MCIGVPLVEEQEEELATLNNAIDQNKAGESSLNEILSEAEKSGEGRGQVLKSVWNTEREKASFFKDQMKNSMLNTLTLPYDRVCVCGCLCVCYYMYMFGLSVCAYFTAETVSKGNRWSLITYRLGK